MKLVDVEDSEIELCETYRKALPMHFLFRIEAFSLLAKNSIDKYESEEFETGGYKWKLSVYPDGNKNENGGKGHISLYLMLVNDSTSSLPVSWELNVFVKLFLFDQIQDGYLIRGDVEGETRRFHEMKKVWGFPQFVSLSKFNDPKNGYLVDDTCVFGAEIFIAKPPTNILCLSMVKEATTVNFTWKIEKFSKIKEECLYSQKFKAGDHNWNVMLYPKGYDSGKDKSVSVHLQLADCKENLALKVLAYFKLRLRDQINNRHFEGSKDKYWFSASSKSWGWHTFIGLSEMNKKGNGYLVKDTCIVEAEVKYMCRFNLLFRNIKIYPKGVSEGSNQSISLSLRLADSNFTRALKVYTKFELLVENQMCGYKTMREGWGNFKELAQLTNEDIGFLVNDTVIVGAQITVLGVVQKLP